MSGTWHLFASVGIGWRLLASVDICSSIIGLTCSIYFQSPTFVLEFSGLFIYFFFVAMSSGIAVCNLGFLLLPPWTVPLWLGKIFPPLGMMCWAIWLHLLFCFGLSSSINVLSCLTSLLFRALLWFGALQLHSCFDLWQGCLLFWFGVELFYVWILRIFGLMIRGSWDVFVSSELWSVIVYNVTLHFL